MTPDEREEFDRNFYMSKGGKRVRNVAVASFFVLMLFSFVALSFGAPTDTVWTVACITYICAVSISVP